MCIRDRSGGVTPGTRMLLTPSQGESGGETTKQKWQHSDYSGAIYVYLRALLRLAGPVLSKGQLVRVLAARRMQMMWLHCETRAVVWLGLSGIIRLAASTEVPAGVAFLPHGSWMEATWP
eukprot:2000092-Amphidinium_carterae.1